VEPRDLCSSLLHKLLRRPDFGIEVSVTELENVKVSAAVA
jgi:hypothetical protein